MMKPTSFLIFHCQLVELLDLRLFLNLILVFAFSFQSLKLILWPKNKLLKLDYLYKSGLGIKYLYSNWLSISFENDYLVNGC